MTLARPKDAMVNSMTGSLRVKKIPVLEVDRFILLHVAHNSVGTNISVVLIDACHPPWV
jgi:hypothetical protein